MAAASSQPLNPSASDANMHAALMLSCCCCCCMHPLSLLSYPVHGCRRSHAPRIAHAAAMCACIFMHAHRACFLYRCLDCCCYCCPCCGQCMPCEYSGRDLCGREAHCTWGAGAAGEGVLRTAVAEISRCASRVNGRQICYYIFALQLRQRP